MKFALDAEGSGHSLVDFADTLLQCHMAVRDSACGVANGVVVSILKKGDRRVCSNYWGITLLRLLGKMYSRVLERASNLESSESNGDSIYWPLPGLSLVTNWDIHGQDLKAQPGGREYLVWKPQNCVSAICR